MPPGLRHVVLGRERYPASRVEYLESDGSQWIDTGFTPTSGTTVEIGYYMPSPAHSNVAMFGSRYSYGFRSYCIWARVGVWPEDVGNIRFDYTGTSTSNVDGPAAKSGEWVAVKKRANRNFVNGTEIAANAAATFSCERSAYLFAVNDSGKANFVLPGRISYCRVYDGGTLVRDFVPWRIGSEGVMLDRANPTGGPDGDGVYRNRGSGRFAVGRDVPYWGLRFRAKERTTVSMVATGTPPSVALQVSLDGGWTWSNFDPSGDSVTLRTGRTACFRAGPSGNRRFATSGSHYWSFSLTGKAEARGSVMSLLSADESAQDVVGTGTAASNYAFAHLFRGSPIVTAPELPATTLTMACYNSMFRDCVHLKAPPALPATALINNCYLGMFWNCRALASAPELPAETLANSCYNGMFYSCDSLTAAPALPATALADGCYASMFQKCSKLGGVVSLPAATLVDKCYNYMFVECTSLEGLAVGFSSWLEGATSSWLSAASPAGVFRCPAGLDTASSQYRNVSHCPAGWSTEPL